MRSALTRTAKQGKCCEDLGLKEGDLDLGFGGVGVGGAYFLIRFRGIVYCSSERRVGEPPYPEHESCPAMYKVCYVKH